MVQASESRRVARNYANVDRQSSTQLAPHVVGFPGVQIVDRMSKIRASNTAIRHGDKGAMHHRPLL